MRSVGGWRSVLTAAMALVSVAGAASTGREQPAPTGSVTGRVTLVARVRGAALRTNAYSPRLVSRQEPPSVPEVQNVVTYLKDVTYTGPLPVMRRQILQAHEAFVPRVVAITRGSFIEFPNFDPFFHNVFSLSAAGTFDLGRYADGHSRSRQFLKAGLVKVYCQIHSHMSASILVLDHPYFAMPDVDGRFTVPNVPVGDYTLVAWHERVGEDVTRVSVQPGQNTTLEIALPLLDSQ